jgi:hypothetical protein
MNEATPRVWFLSTLDRLGSVRVGACVMLGLWALALAAALLVGNVPPRGIVFATMFPLLLGYTLAVSPVVLSRLLVEFDELKGIDRIGVPGQVAATVAGLAINLMLGALSEVPAEQIGEIRWFTVFASSLWWIVFAPMSFIFVRILWRLRRLGMVANVNLLDARPLAEFGRAASLITLYIGAFVAVGTFGIVVTRTFIAETGEDTVPLLVVTVLTCFVIAAVYLPLSGARRAIRAAKRAELARIGKQFGHHDEVLVAFDGPERADRLMAYRERVAGVAEWPFGVGTAPRALFYVTLPLLSWIAAALVERALGSVLD